MESFKQTVVAAAHFLRAQLNDINIDTIIILGSGLSDLSIQGTTLIKKIPYQDIPGLTQSTAPSHAGELGVYQTLAGKFIAVCAGRHHLYEGYSAQQVCTLIYVLNQIGAHKLIITNAAGALNESYRPGEVMIINDHINFTGQNPLIGQDDSFGMRFPDMSDAYNRALLSGASGIAQDNNIHVHHGIYAGVTGPSLETSAERRMLRTLGADAVGMSTVMEVIAAKHCGMSVIGLSAITNLALGNKDQQPDTIEEVLENAATAGVSIKKIIAGLFC